METKFCKDCRYYVINDWDVPECHHPKSLRTHQNLVTGHVKEEWLDCWNARHFDDSLCSKRGDWFEPRLPIDLEEMPTIHIFRPAEWWKKFCKFVNKYGPGF
jgi:hypothetical protein